MTTSSSTKRRFSVAALILALLLRPTLADWPFARGDAESTGATDVSLPDEPKTLWTYKVENSAFEATPVIAAGVVYAGDADGTMHAVRLAKGEKIWSQKLGDTFLLSPCAVWDEALFVPDADGMVHCLATSDGAERWVFDIGSEMYGGPIVHESGSKRILLLPTEGGTLFGLDAATGEELWTFEIDAPLRCCPTVVGGHAMLAGCDGKLHAIDVATGKETGACEIGGPTGNTAAVREGVAYFGTEGGTFFAIDATDPTSPTVKWDFRDPRRGQGIRTAAALAEKAIVYASQAKTVYGLDPATGDLAWKIRTRGAVEASPLALAGGRALVLTRRGRVLLLDAATGDEVWSDDFGGEFIASPTASDGRVVLANTDGSLVCLGRD